MKKHLKGSLLIISAMTLFGLVGVFVRSINIKAEILLFASSALLTFGLLVYYVISKKIGDLWNGKIMVWYLLVGLFLIGNVYSYLRAFSLTTFSNAVLSHYLAPVIAALSAPIIVNETIENRTKWALVISIIGLFLMSYENLKMGNVHMIGLAFGLISAVFYGISINIVKRLLNNNATPLSIIFYQSAIPAILLIPFISRSAFAIINGRIGLILLYTLFATLIPVVMLFAGVKHIKAQHVGILAYSEVVAAILFGLILFNEIPSSSTIMGGVLILLSGFMIIKSKTHI